MDIPLDGPTPQLKKEPENISKPKNKEKMSRIGYFLIELSGIILAIPLSLLSTSAAQAYIRGTDFLEELDNFSTIKMISCFVAYVIGTTIKDRYLDDKLYKTHCVHEAETNKDSINYREELIKILDGSSERSELEKKTVLCEAFYYDMNDGELPKRMLNTMNNEIRQSSLEDLTNKYRNSLVHNYRLSKRLHS